MGSNATNHLKVGYFDNLDKGTLNKFKKEKEKNIDIFFNIIT
jgi:hypothetical protein